MGGSSRSAPTVTSSTSNSAPWDAAQPFMKETMGEAQNLYNNDVGFKPYTGRMQANTDARTTEALGTAEGIARQGNTGFANAYQGLADMAGGADVGRINPALQTMLDGNARMVANRTNSAMSGAGRYGSGAHSEMLSRGITEATAPLLYQDYNDSRQRQMQASQMLPGAYDAQFAPSRQLAGVGGYFEDREQTDLNNLIQQNAAAEARPWENLARYNAIVGGAGSMGGTQVSTGMQPSNAPSRAQTALGGAIAGGSAFGPLGALGGGLLGMF